MVETPTESKRTTLATPNVKIRIRMGIFAVLLIATSLYMFVSEFVLFGMTIPTPLRITLSVLGMILGLWIVYANLERTFSRDPAISVDQETILFHVNPGRKLTLLKEQITEVSEIYSVAHTKSPIGRFLQTWVLGSKAFKIHTDLREGLFASSILVASDLVQEDISTVREKIMEQLKS